MADEVLEILLTLDANGYVASARRVRTANNQLSDSVDNVTRKTKSSASAFSQIGSGFQRFGGIVSAGTSLLQAATVALAGLGAAAAVGGYTVSRAADFESLTMALNAVEGSATKASAKLKELRQIAKGPGLGVTEAIETYMGLRRGGVDQSMATRITKELGNMVAMSGGGKEVLGRAGLAISQIALTEFLQGDELRQLTEAGLPAYAIVKQLFGTADTEKLKQAGITSKQVLAGLLAEMEKMPRVAGGVKNSLENLVDAADQAAIQFGTAVAGFVVGPGGSITEAFENMVEDGFFTTFAETIMQNFLAAIAPITGGATTAEDALTELAVHTVGLTVLFRNFTNNLAGAVDAASDYKDWWLRNVNAVIDFFGGGSKDPATEGVGIRSVSEEMDMFRDQIELEKRLREQRREKAEKQAAVTDEPAAGTDGPAKPNAKVTPLLREIAENTRPLKQIADALLGGGAFASAWFNARNVAAVSGRGELMIIEGMRMMQTDAMIGAARSKAFGPASV